MSILNAVAQQYFQQLNERIDLSFLKQSEYQLLLELLSLSDFVAQSLIQQPDLLHTLLDKIDSAIELSVIESELQTLLLGVESEQQLHRVLRQFRRKYMVLIACRELIGQADVQESFINLSFLADQFISQSLAWLYQWQCKQQGIPVSESGQVLRLYILAMGKLGGQELNFSSDIDLIFCYPERGRTQGGRRVVESPNFFSKLGQRLISALHQVTVDGFVYRVDMRLRPFGDAGPLVSTFSSLEDYYQSHGRDWERYAMIKARVLGEEGEYKLQLEKLLRPFVFKRYVDFSAIDSLRKMKSMISAEVRRKQLQDNIKLGLGGIREVEFIAQAIQLIHGGRYPALQCKGLLQTLNIIAEYELMQLQQVEQLTGGYCLLRKVENILQQIGDKQTQTLPDNERDRLRLTKVMGAQDWQSLYQLISKTMQAINNIFTLFIGNDQAKQESIVEVYAEIWQLQLTQQEIAPLLAEGIVHKQFDTQQIHTLSKLILSFKEEIKKRPIGARGQDTLDALMPKVIALIGEYDEPQQLFERIQQVILNIMRRTAYLQLLNENEGALKQLLELCSASPRVAAQLARYPILLDELLDPQHLYQPTELGQYAKELQQFMLRIPEDDMEQQMEALRQFKQMQFLHIATADIAKGITLPEVSDHLTQLSEVLLGYVVQLAWTQLIERFGLPSNVLGTDNKGFSVIGYGKMGGFELGYGSDLDVVFLHQRDINGDTNGPRSIDNQRFYYRLAQRIIHIFSTRTNSGVLYEIDMRLRPSGDSGPLVTSIAGFLGYLQSNAWTWELQALVRARTVYSEPQMRQEFIEIRRAILSQNRDVEKLKKEVIAMRNKMREHLHRANTGEFDLKQSPGGMVDIEFIAQYLVLAHAQQFEQVLCQWSDNLRIFSACLQVELLTEQQANALSNAYCHIRDAAHRLTLNKQTRVLDDTLFVEDRKAVIDIWESLLG